MTRPTTTGKAQDLITFTRSTTGTYLGSDGLLKSAAIDEARIEYDAEGNCLGLLVEEARTNVLTYSEALIVSNNRAIAESSVSPTGEQTAQTWRVDGSKSNHPYMYGSANIVSGTTYTCSVFVRLPTSGPTVEPRYVKLTSQTRIQGGSTIFDLQEGTVVSSNMLSESITPVGNGWYRISVTNIATSSGASFSFILWPTINAAGAVYEVSASDDGKALFETFGMQTEAGSFPTSYIPTSGSAVTRAADVASLAVSEFGYNQDQGTVVIDYDAKYNSSYSASSYTRIAELQSDSNNRMTLYLGHDGSAAALYIRTSSSNQGSPATTNAAQVGLDKVAFSVASNSANICLNGGTVGVSTSVTVPSVTSLLIGDSNAAGYLNGHIKSVQYYPLRLSNAQLQALTV